MHFAPADASQAEIHSPAGLSGYKGAGIRSAWMQPVRAPNTNSVYWLLAVVSPRTNLAARPRFDGWAI